MTDHSLVEAGQKRLEEVRKAFQAARANADRALPVQQSPISIYTDGAAISNSGIGGWAAILCWDSGQEVLTGSELHTTSNRMELRALIEALKHLESPQKVIVYTDSAYLLEGIDKWIGTWRVNSWQKQNGHLIANGDLWRELFALTQKHKIAWRWVKAHSGNEMNEWADQIARRSCRKEAERVLPTKQTNLPHDKTPQVDWQRKNALKSIEEMRERDGINPQRFRRQDSGGFPLVPPESSNVPALKAGTPLLSPAGAVIAPAPATPPLSKSVKHYPSLGLAAYQQEEAALYRVWLLCRYIDQAGRGWLDIGNLRELLTEKESQLHLCSWRHLRHLINEGDGKYWHAERDHRGWFHGKLWMSGAYKLSANLGLKRLYGLPVELPEDVLTDEIGKFRANLYAAWHSGRSKSNPIARSTQQELTGVPERTQRHYCKLAGVDVQENYAVEQPYTEEAYQEAAFESGYAVYKHYDHGGVMGQRHKAHIARQIPNSYGCPHEPSPKGRLRKINRELKEDLVIHAAPGNNEAAIDGQRYYENGLAAAKAFNRNKYKVAYWPLNHNKLKTNMWGKFAA